MSSDQTSQTETTAAPAPTSRGQRPTSEAFRRFIADQWAPRPAPTTEARDVASFTVPRRAAVSDAFPGKRLVFPAGPLKQRNNDCDYRFRPHSAFAHLTGLGQDEEPDAVLVFEPTDSGHDAVLFFRPLADRDTTEFYGNAQYGELWVGVRPSLEDFRNQLGLECRHVDELTDALTKNVTDGGVDVMVVREADLRITALLDEARGGASDTVEAADADLARFASELRLVKDSYEVEQMRLAVAATVTGFERIVEHLPQAVAHVRGERVVESAFSSVARIEGNGLGYDVIAASGNHACTLHWTRNDGPVRDGEMILVDAGVEVDSLYTADITRTIPVNGSYSPQQRQVYQAVLDAADAAFSVVKPGVTFRSVHEAAMQVIAERLVEWGFLSCTVAETLDEATGGYHRRWMVHGTSHHLGIDVHDCAQARREMYVDAELREGMIFTIEPGLYFKADDLSVPEEFRGIGVRIEDNVLVTADGYENLSSALPRDPDGVEVWMRGLRK